MDLHTLPLLLFPLPEADIYRRLEFSMEKETRPALQKVRGHPRLARRGNQNALRVQVDGTTNPKTCPRDSPTRLETAPAFARTLRTRRHGPSIKIRGSSRAAHGAVTHHQSTVDSTTVAAQGAVMGPKDHGSMDCHSRSRHGSTDGRPRNQHGSTDTR